MKAGWQVKPLGEIADFVMGQAPAGKDCNKNGIGTPFVKAGEFGLSRPVIREWTTDPKKHAKSTDVLICVVGATCGKINLGADCAIGRSAAAVRPDAEKLDQFYLHYFLEGKVQEFRDGSLGAAQTVISKNMLAEMSIPAPPLEEQKRIVAVLDAALEGLTRAKENAEANLQNARELFENYLSAIFDTSEGGQASKLGKGVEILTGFAFKSAEYSENVDDMAMVRGDNIVQGLFRWKDVKRWPLDKCDEFNKFRLAADDVLLAMDRTWVKNGIKYAIVREADLPLLLVQRVARLRCLTTLSNEYLGYFIGSKQFEKYVLSIQTGMGVPHISGQQIKDCPFYLPDMPVQLSTVAELNAIRSKVEVLEADYRTKLTDIADLRQSLLQKAFAGELTLG